MSEEEQKKEETEATPVEETAAAEATKETPAAEEAPVEEAPVEEETPAEEPVADDAVEEAPAEAAPEPSEPDPLDALPWKERRRILKSRESGEAGPTLTGEERDTRRIAERKQKASQRRRRRAEEKKDAPEGSGIGSAVAEKTRTGKPKQRQGLVTSDKSDKTIVVQIDSARRHPVYEKIVRQRHKIHVHDEQNEASEGDLVRVIETRKLSKTKHWNLVEIIEKAR